MTSPRGAVPAASTRDTCRVAAGHTPTRLADSWTALRTIPVHEHPASAEGRVGAVAGLYATLGATGGSSGRFGRRGRGPPEYLGAPLGPYRPQR